MQVIIDRFEGAYAVVETQTLQTFDLPLALVPEGAREGDTLQIELVQTDRQASIQDLMDALFEDEEKGL